MKLLFLGNVKQKINFYIILFLASVLTSCGGGSGGSIPSKDNVDPSVTLTIPANNARDVLDSTSIQVVFNEDMDKQSVESGIVINTKITASVTYDAISKTATYLGMAPIVGDTTYTIIVRSTVKDTAGNFIVGNQSSGDYVWTFTTLDNISPTIINKVPVDDPVGTIPVSLNSTIVVNFSEEIKLDSLKGDFIVNSNSNNKNILGQFLIDGSKVIFTPDVPVGASNALSYNTIYTVTIKTGVTDLKNNQLKKEDTYSFKTVVDKRPRYSFVYPSIDNAKNIAKRPSIKVKFTSRMVSALINSETFRLTDLQDNLIVGSYNYDPTTQIATFIPDSNLKLLHSYKIILTSLLKDEAGNALILNNNGVQNFSIEDGVWNVGSLPLVTPQLNQNIFSSVITSNNNNEAAILWEEVDTTIPSFSYVIYSKLYSQINGWDKNAKTVVTALTNHGFGFKGIDAKMDMYGRVLMIYTDIDSTIPSALRYHSFFRYYVNTKWIYKEAQIDTVNDSTSIEKLIMSPKGEALVLLNEKSLNSTTQYFSSRFNTPPISLPSNLIPTWQAINLVDRVGTFGGINADGLPVLIDASISTAGTATIIYYQTDNANKVKNIWSNLSPFQTSTPNVLEHSDIDIGSQFLYSELLNGDAVLSFDLIDGSNWISKFSPLTGWEQEIKATTIPAKASIVKSILFSNNDEMIIFHENGILKSTLYNSVTGWETPQVVSLTKMFVYNILKAVGDVVNVTVAYNEDTDLLTAIWVSKTSIISRRYIPKLGWQVEKIITAVTSPTGEFELNTIHNSDGSALVLWKEYDSKLGRTEIFSATLK